ncbi:hypothetical protein ISP15_15935 [Dyella jejuensis]|uniref:Uncharacterized protein n=1 Tax=Dyella jejuensis TaxID=1432009 RepID=A0ABW8JLI1_9GAMM
MLPDVHGPDPEGDGVDDVAAGLAGLVKLDVDAGCRGVVEVGEEEASVGL